MTHDDIPAGWVLVPRMPTDEMLEAGGIEADASWQMIESAWHAMINATPSARPIAHLNTIAQGGVA